MKSTQTKNQLMQKLKNWIKKRPLATFIIIITMLIGLIIVNNLLTRPKTNKENQVKKIVKVGVDQTDGQQLKTIAKVNNQGVIEIVAQTGGVVQQILVSEGQKVSKGQSLIQMSTNYQGNNLAGLQAELAEKSWLLEHANFWDQDQLNQITRDLTQLQTNHSLGMSDNPLTNYNLNQKQTINEIGDKMQDRGLELKLDSSEINFKIAQINASLMRPSTPVRGDIEKINVKIGQLVSPGQVVAIVKADKDQTQLKVSLSEQAMTKIDISKMATFELDGQQQVAKISFLPTVPNQGNGYSLNLTPTSDIASQLIHGQYVTFNLPLSQNEQQKILISIHCVYQTQNGSFVYVAEINELGELIARQKKVQLGTVIGELVIVEDGLENEQKVLTNNALLDGQLIELING